MFELFTSSEIWYFHRNPRIIKCLYMQTISLFMKYLSISFELHYPNDSWCIGYHSGLWILRPEFESRRGQLFITFCQTSPGKISNFHFHRKSVRFPRMVLYLSSADFWGLSIYVTFSKIGDIKKFNTPIILILSENQPVCVGNQKILDDFSDRIFQ